MKSFRFFVLSIATTIVLAFGLTFFSSMISFAQPNLQPALVGRPTPPEAQALGNEPFWNVTVTPKGIVYSTPESKVTFPYTKALQAQGRPEDFTFVYNLKKGRQQGVLVFNKAACNDGMSDRQYEYATTLVLNNKVQAGCGIGRMFGIATP
jgi:uncharacterized membrane protein